LQSQFSTEVVKRRQGQWLKERNKCKDKDCLKTIYEKRIIALVNGVDIPKRWYIQQGKGKPLCESLARIANKNPSIGLTPNIPWEQVLLIEGIREPEWIELDPAQHEKIFLTARNLMETNIRHLQDEQALPFVRWFKSPKERWHNDAVRAIPITDEEALGNYRDFVKRGGNLKVLHAYIGDETGKVIKDIVQYESPEKDFSNWDGYSLLAETGLSGLPDANYPFTNFGRGFRILIYKNNLFSFFGLNRGVDEYRVTQLNGERVDSLSPWYCKINSEIQQGVKE